MKIVFVANAMTPHQMPLCDAFVNINGVELKFIETKNIDRASLPIGWRSDHLADYVVSYSEFCKDRDKYDRCIFDADAVILSGDLTHLVRNRLNAGKLTFVYSERIYRTTKQKLKLPYHYLKFQKRYNKYPNLYLLCASAFTYSDFKKIGCFSNKAFKWGYFINAPIYNPTEIIQAKRQHKKIKIAWIARHIAWKHPEVPVYLAKRLKGRNIGFEVNMYGSGPESVNIQNLILSTDTSDCVHLRGELPNNELMAELRDHEIFLFTSDRNEGWGAVANEAMANACALVGSSAIGSIPYLVDHKVNGMIYENGNIDSLEECVMQLINDTSERERMSLNAYETLSGKWSPQNAALNFTKLVRHLNDGESFDIPSGPCSKAEKLRDNWFRHRK